MVEPGGEGSNHLTEVFEELQRWEECLKHLDIPELSEGPEVGP